MQNKNSITLVPDSASYTAVQTFLEQRLEEDGVSLRVQNRVQVAADEIWSNIVHYSGATQASLTLRPEGETLLLYFADNGKPYDPTAAPEPDTTLSADERSIGGLGLHMVRKMTTAMTYRFADGENKLELTFDIK